MAHFNQNINRKIFGTNLLLTVIKISYYKNTELLFKQLINVSLFLSFVICIHSKAHVLEVIKCYIMAVPDLDIPLLSSLFDWGFKDRFLHIFISIGLCTL